LCEDLKQFRQGGIKRRLNGQGLTRPRVAESGLRGMQKKSFQTQILEDSICFS
jgi:hypothetical protein